MSNEVSIAITADTLTALANSGFSLYGFRAVSNSDLGGRPLVWLCMPHYAATTTVTWSNQYAAYISNSPIVPNQKVLLGTGEDITVGETLQVAAGGIVTVVNEGPSTAISILNTTSQSLTCGLAENQNGTILLFCAFPLNGNSLDVITPVERLVLIFSTVSVTPGTVIDQSFSYAGPGAYSAAIVIELDEDEQRSVSFDINKGWSWGSYSWGQQIPGIVNLLPYLIETQKT